MDVRSLDTSGLTRPSTSPSNERHRQAVASNASACPRPSTGAIKAGRSGTTLSWLDVVSASLEDLDLGATIIVAADIRYRSGGAAEVGHRGAQVRRRFGVTGIRASRVARSTRRVAMTRQIRRSPHGRLSQSRRRLPGLSASPRSSSSSPPASSPRRRPPTPRSRSQRERGFDRCWPSRTTTRRCRFTTRTPSARTPTARARTRGAASAAAAAARRRRRASAAAPGNREGGGAPAPAPAPAAASSAAAAATPALPAGWASRATRRVGTPTTSARRPARRSGTRRRRSSPPRRRRRRRPPATGLPPGWVAGRDPASGAVYYAAVDRRHPVASAAASADARARAGAGAGGRRGGGRRAVGAGRDGARRGLPERDGRPRPARDLRVARPDRLVRRRAPRVRQPPRAPPLRPGGVRREGGGRDEWLKAE